MPVRQGTFNNLKDLGSMPWQKVVSEGLYSESLILNKLPKANFIAGDVVEEEISNRKEGYCLRVRLDKDFLKAKLKRHICQYFDKSQEKEFLAFCKEVWAEHQTSELDRVINDLIALKGGTRDEWLAKLK